MAARRIEDKRRRILDAAVQVFAEKGYFASRVTDVARAAGVADGTIYLYFQNKDHLLVSLLDEVMSEHLEAGRREVKRLKGAPARLRAIARRHLGLLGGHRDLAVVFQVELRQSTKFMERFTASWLKDYFDVLEEVIQGGQRDGTIRRDLPRTLAAHTFFGALDAVVTSWVLSRRSYDIIHLADPLVQLFLEGATINGKR